MTTRANIKLPLIDSNDALNPTVSVVRITYMYKGEALDKTKGNWLDWSADMRDCLDINTLGDHIEPDYVRPPLQTQPTAHRNWGLNDRAVSGFLRANCAKVERDLLMKAKAAGKNARECWVLLESMHVDEGPVRQADLIRGAFSASIARDKDQVTKARKIRDDIMRAFDMSGGITKESLVNVAFIKALGPGHEHTLAFIKYAMLNASKSAPFESEEVIAYLERDLWK